MAIAIHHGPNGSFKSFGVVQRFAVPALQEGRTVITNIKGFDCIDRICEALGVNIPQDAELLYIDTQGNDEAKDYLARWFHWAPFAALLVLDECQTLYREGRGGFDPNSVTIKPDDNVEPVAWTDSEGNTQHIERPSTLWEAFERHRHFNWDVFLVSPNIGKVHKELRLNTEFAFRHRNMTGVLPWKFKPCWKEVKHDPENSGKSLSHVIQAREYKADPRIWKCYKSTETGEHRDSLVGLKIFKSPKLLFYLAIMLFGFLAFGMAMVSVVEGRKADRAPVKDSVASSVPKNLDLSVSDGVRHAASTTALARDGIVVSLANQPQFQLTRITGHGTYGERQHYIFEAQDGKDTFTITSRELEKLGFAVRPVNRCMAQIVADKQYLVVMCRKIEPEPITDPFEYPQPLQLMAGG
ncbi:zonular occludens toxin family protein [Microbulbifer sp. DLAB2-AA]|uniref:zonular occludens toxin family protein n=1 Tax=Microbulbifer sp. DLAB2-AA TaxID=3243394 RepID=UPI00403952AE